MIIESILLASIIYASFKPIPTTNDKTKKTELAETTINQLSKPKARPVQVYSGLAAISFATIGTFWYWPLAILSAPFSIAAVWPKHQQAATLLSKRQISVDTIISLGIMGSLVIGQYFIASIIVLLTGLADKLMAKVTRDCHSGLLDAFSHYHTSDTDQHRVWIIDNGVELEIKLPELVVGDIVIVQAGEIIPADGIVIDGFAQVDERVLSGESYLVTKAPQQSVYAMTMVSVGKIYFKVTQMLDDTVVGKITSILNNTLNTESAMQLRAVNLADQLVKPTLVTAAAAMPLLGPNSAMAIVNAHPKNKMLIVTPISILNMIRLALQQGILIKDGRCLERLATIDTIIFDKTGTLTQDQYQLFAIHPYSQQFSSQQLLTFAAAIEQYQTHPLAQAIYTEAKRLNLTLPVVEQNQYLPGYGLASQIQGHQVHIGSDRLMQHANIVLPDTALKSQHNIYASGHTCVFVAIDNTIVGGIELKPTLRPEVNQLFQQLRQHPQIKSIYIMSGDNIEPTKQLAEKLKVDAWFAETSPFKKAEIIDQLQQQGRSVCYVGDGINDAIALKKAHIAISINQAAPIAVDTAQIVLLDQGIKHVNTALQLAEDFHSHMDRSFTIMLAPVTAGIVGAFGFGLGIGHIVTMNMAGLAVGLGHAMSPTTRH